MTHPIVFNTKPNATRCPAEERFRYLENPGFGKVFTDHMVTIAWSRAAGWHDAQVRAREPFRLDPASSVLHYAQEIFEGMKAFRSAGGDITLFRPWKNARRFNESAKRMAMPELPEAVFLEAVERLLNMDAMWVPEGNGSLYLRPFMFSDEVFLGVRPAEHYIFCVIASPAGPYFKGGEKPIKVWVSENYSRAATGGTGAAKCGGNYAAGLMAQSEAVSRGCDQVVFLDAAEGRWVEELGGMNIFFVMEDGTMRTPPLGTILAGITRDSIIELARSMDISVEEIGYSFDQWKADAASGFLQEVFVCGTAAAVACVGHVEFQAGSFDVASGRKGPITHKLQQALVGAQRGEGADLFRWRKSLRSYPSP